MLGLSGKKDIKAIPSSDGLTKAYYSQNSLKTAEHLQISNKKKATHKHETFFVQMTCLMTFSDKRQLYRLHSKKVTHS